MIHIITTRNLTYHPISGIVFSRECGHFLGFVWDGPGLPMDLDIVGEWADLQAWEISQMGAKK